ncbi:MAG: hypothetical protein KUA37_11750 [Desulfomicrobium sp.]|nr:hypothetical protein [Alphaproteobacteria bacterium]MBU4545015.1 hypothetical protein [Alphaproteobacteria bacterium]MBU4552422.1 hypothetical protein [Alphaproteobacteria bacterium]MBV1712658.1 hypothetical protein [Desulfomicrobium sp.]MBV1783573.1 hypothetical protein [Hoeflea sp.]
MQNPPALNSRGILFRSTLQSGSAAELLVLPGELEADTTRRAQLLELETDGGDKDDHE